MVEDTFASAHQLIGYEGPCENLHGHTWKAQIFLLGDQLNKLGMLFDFKEAKSILREIINKFDHTNINTMVFFKEINPTAENISRVFYEEFAKRIPSEIKVSKVIIWESEKTCAQYSL